MKNLFILLFFPFFCFSQDFVIPKPNIEELEAELNSREFLSDEVYLYLIKNFDSIASKKDLKYYDYDSNSICSFNQGFDKNINYFTYNQCNEEGGSSSILTLPKTDRKSLIIWVEQIFKIYPTDIDHSWNSEMTIFRPTDEGAGCYYEIIEKKSSTMVKIYCGC